MSRSTAVPDAWDDDWESQADRANAVPKTTKAEDEVKLTKAERLALHKQSQKKLWETAEEPETPYFLAAREAVPLTQEFKPALKVLSRKPTPNRVQKIDPLTGLAKMTIEDDDDDDEVKRDLRTPEELRLQAQRNREEKQRIYNEARARILGTPSGSSTPGGGQGKRQGKRGWAGRDIASAESVWAEGSVRSELHAEARSHDSEAYWRATTDRKIDPQGRGSRHPSTERTRR
ncbi:hypothetical protein B2J93_5215 [Marssonina coronariae]|uniref:SUZ domain-containing protein n=1 Tax=Diplocarpon coronariae TaxID=2795749 RepID=A0A218Z4B9_9HELO|nr:hypothetical protein B2J93_5215 [Marssonina coronariae]